MHLNEYLDFVFSIISGRVDSEQILEDVVNSRSGNEIGNANVVNSANSDHADLEDDPDAIRTLSVDLDTGHGQVNPSFVSN